MTTSAESQTKAALVASSTLSALVGNWIFPDEIPDVDDDGGAVNIDVKPGLSYERADSDPQYGLNNELYATKVSILVTCWAKSRALAEQVAAAVAAAMFATFNSETGRGSAYEPQLEQYAVLLTFDVWETD